MGQEGSTSIPSTKQISPRPVAIVFLITTCTSSALWIPSSANRSRASFEVSKLLEEDETRSARSPSNEKAGLSTYTPSSKNFFAFQMVMRDVGEDEMTMMGVVFPEREKKR